MQELEKKMQSENFDMEVQSCDPDSCFYDCLLPSGHCNTQYTNLWQFFEVFVLI